MADEAGSGVVSVTLRRPLRLGGFGLSSAQFTSPLAFIASTASFAAQPGSHPLSDGALPSVSLLHQWLRTALTCPTVTDIQDHGCTGMHYDTDTFITHFHNQPSHALQPPAPSHHCGHQHFVQCPGESVAGSRRRGERAGSTTLWQGEVCGALEDGATD